jgi:hypothetical protein
MNTIRHEQAIKRLREQKSKPCHLKRVESEAYSAEANDDVPPDEVDKKTLYRSCRQKFIDLPSLIIDLLGSFCGILFSSIDHHAHDLDLGYVSKTPATARPFLSIPGDPRRRGDSSASRAHSESLPWVASPTT